MVNNNTPTDDKHYIELDMISDLVADYEEMALTYWEPVLDFITGFLLFLNTVCKHNKTLSLL